MNRLCMLIQNCRSPYRKSINELKALSMPVVSRECHDAPRRLPVDFYVFCLDYDMSRVDSFA
jgi:hypothetical protein